MHVILKKDIPQIGRIGEVVKVHDGYARNFLIPRSLAVAAHSGNLGAHEHQKRLVDIHKKKIQKESEELSQKFKALKVNFKRRFNESGKMFGSLTPAEVAAELETKGIKIDRRDVEMDAIKAPGEYAIRLRLPGDVFLDATLELEAQQEKAAAKKTKSAAGAKKTKTGTKTKKSAKAADETEAETEGAEPKNAEEAD